MISRRSSPKPRLRTIDRSAVTRRCLHGLPAIRAWLESQLGQRVDSVPWHYVTDTIVDLDGDTASCHAYMHNRHMRIVGVYETNAVRTPDGWRFEWLQLAARGLPGIAIE